MADKPAKRRVKNPESFRERALKAAEESDKPKRVAKVRSGGVSVIGTIFRPIGRVLTPIGRLKPVRLLGKVLLPPYVRNSWRELKQVTWPNWQQSRQLTFAVLIFAVLFGAVIALVDFGLDKLFKQVLLK